MVAKCRVMQLSPSLRATNLARTTRLSERPISTRRCQCKWRILTSSNKWRRRVALAICRSNSKTSAPPPQKPLTIIIRTDRSTSPRQARQPPPPSSLSWETRPTVKTHSKSSRMHSHRRLSRIMLVQQTRWHRRLTSWWSQLNAVKLLRTT